MYLKKTFILFSILLVSLLSIPACTSNRDGTELPPAEQAEEKEEKLPPIDYPKKGNPKLDSHLWRLIEAEKLGEDESLARTWSRGDDVVDGKVRVEIEGLPGQLDAAVVAVAAVGTVEIISQRLNGLQAVMPITSLEVLANEGTIRFVRLPELPMLEAE
ncbi:hypothetical protein ACFLUU_00910 [Chloroflexota bacterium]